MPDRNGDAPGPMLHALLAARDLGAEPDPADPTAVLLWLGASAEQASRCALGQCDHATR